VKGCEKIAQPTVQIPATTHARDGSAPSSGAVFLGAFGVRGTDADKAVKDLRNVAHACISINKRSRDSSVSKVSDYGLDDRGSILDRGRGFFF
jgi:hypothetical protein